MSDDDNAAGVSRCSISGFFDELGNPAALASGKRPHSGDTGFISSYRRSSCNF